MKLKIWIKKQVGEKRDIEFSVYKNEGEIMFFMLTEAAPLDDHRSVTGNYAQGVIDGALTTLGFSESMENIAIKTMIRLHPHKSVMMVYETGKSEVVIVP